MEENTSIGEASSSVTETSTPVVDTTTPSMETGGSVNGGGDKLGWVGIMMLGLASASLIYSIFYYKKRLEALKNGDNKAIAQMQGDLNEMKSKIDTLTGKKTRYATFV